MNLNNIFLIADADGTLLTDDKRILEKDKSAIRELTRSGGLFTIATGRGVSLARVVAENLKLKIPAVIFNGAAVYDFKQDKFLWQCALPKSVKEYIKLLMEKFPTLAIEILRDDEVYVTRTNAREEEHIAFGNTEPVRCGLDEIPEYGWIKALLIDEPETIDEVILFSKKKRFKGVHMVRSAPIFYEMLPSGINKGTGLKKLLEIMELHDKYTVAMGDFMNDIEMLRQADLGVAVENAEDVVKAVAKLIVCDNNSGAVYNVIEHLKAKSKTKQRKEKS